MKGFKNVLLCCTHLTALQSASATCEMSNSFLEAKPRLVVLCEELEGLSQRWREIGDYLELTDEELDRVESQCGSNPSECMRIMLKAWLKKGEPPPTWKFVLKVVNRMDPDLALKLR